MRNALTEYFPILVGLLTIFIALYAIVIAVVIVRREFRRREEKVDRYLREWTGLLNALPAKVREVVDEALTSRIPSIEEAKVKEAKKSIPELDLGDLSGIQEDIDRGRFKTAEARLLELWGKYANNFEVFDSLIRVYLDPRSRKNPAEVLNLVLQKRDTFKNDLRYYRLLAACYIAMKDILPDARDKAVEVALMARSKEPEAAVWDHLLGYIYYWFDELEIAIRYAEDALEKARRSGDEERVRGIKNNLAYFYAKSGKAQYRDRALEYARDLEEYSEQEGVSRFDRGKYLDTIGSVILALAESRDEVEKAERILVSALRLIPGRAEILNHLSRCHEKLASLEEVRLG